MNNRNEWFEEFQRNMSGLIAKSPAGDIERNVKALMAQTFSRLDLITREEFDVQQQLLERALARIAALESRVSALEGVEIPAQPAIDDPGVTPAHVPAHPPTDAPLPDPKA